MSVHKMTYHTVYVTPRISGTLPRSQIFSGHQDDQDSPDIVRVQKQPLKTVNLGLETHREPLGILGNIFT